MKEYIKKYVYVKFNSQKITGYYSNSSSNQTKKGILLEYDELGIKLLEVNENYIYDIEDMKINGFDEHVKCNPFKITFHPIQSIMEITPIQSFWLYNSQSSDDRRFYREYLNSEIKIKIYEDKLEKTQSKLRIWWLNWAYGHHKNFVENNKDRMERLVIENDEQQELINWFSEQFIMKGCY